MLRPLHRRVMPHRLLLFTGVAITILGVVGLWRTARLFLRGAARPTATPGAAETDRPQGGCFLAIGAFLSLWCLLVGAGVLLFTIRR